MMNPKLIEMQMKYGKNAYSKNTNHQKEEELSPEEWNKLYYEQEYEKMVKRTNKVLPKNPLLMMGMMYARGMLPGLAKSGYLPNEVAAVAHGARIAPARTFARRAVEREQHGQMGKKLSTVDSGLSSINNLRRTGYSAQMLATLLTGAKYSGKNIMGPLHGGMSGAAAGAGASSAGLMQGLLSTFTNPLFLGMTGLQIGSGILKAKRLKKITPTRQHQSKIEKKYSSFGDKIITQLSSLVQNGQLNPADQIMITQLDAIEKHTAATVGVYEELAFMREEKMKGTSKTHKNIDKLTADPEKSDKGFILNATHSLERLTEFIDLSINPITQLTNLIFGGKSPVRAIQELKSQSGIRTREKKAEEEKDAYVKGISIQDNRLLNTDMSSYINSLPSYEEKMYALGLMQLKLDKISTQQLVSMRKGMGISDVYKGPELTFEDGILGKLGSSIKTGIMSIPGINAAANIVSSLWRVPKFLGDKLTGTYRAGKEMFFGKNFMKLTGNQEELDKATGIHKSLDDRYKEFIAEGLPTEIETLRVLLHNQLEVAKSMEQNQAQHYSIQDSVLLKKDIKYGLAKLVQDNRVWSHISGGYKTVKEADKEIDDVMAAQKDILRQSMGPLATLLSEVTDAALGTRAKVLTKLTGREHTYDKNEFMHWATRRTQSMDMNIDPEEAMFWGTGGKESDDYRKMKLRRKTFPGERVWQKPSVAAMRGQEDAHESIAGKLKYVLGQSTFGALGMGSLATMMMIPGVNLLPLLLGGAGILGAMGVGGASVSGKQKMEGLKRAKEKSAEDLVKQFKEIGITDKTVLQQIKKEIVNGEYENVIEIVNNHLEHDPNLEEKRNSVVDAIKGSEYVRMFPAMVMRSAADAGLTGTSIESRMKTLALRSGSVGERTLDNNILSELKPEDYTPTPDPILPTLTDMLAALHDIQTWKVDPLGNINRGVDDVLQEIKLHFPYIVAHTRNSANRSFTIAKNQKIFFDDMYNHWHVTPSTSLVTAANKGFNVLVGEKGPEVLVGNKKNKQQLNVQQILPNDHPRTKELMGEYNKGKLKDLDTSKAQDGYNTNLGGSMVEQTEEAKRKKEKDDDIMRLMNDIKEQKLHTRFLKDMSDNISKIFTLNKEEAEERKKEKKGWFGDLLGNLLPILTGLATLLPVGLIALNEIFGTDGYTKESGRDWITKRIAKMKIVSGIWDSIAKFSVGAVKAFTTGLTKLFPSTAEGISEILKNTSFSTGKFIGNLADNIFSLPGKLLDNVFKTDAITKFFGDNILKMGEKLGIEKMGNKSFSKILLEIGPKLLDKMGLGVLTKFGSTASKSVLKKIPGLGLLFGGYFAYERFTKGDYLGAILELGSGLASTVPGIGTVVSIGMDALLLIRDFMKTEEDKNKEKQNAADLKKWFSIDFISKKIGELIGIDESNLYTIPIIGPIAHLSKAYDELSSGNTKDGFVNLGKGLAGLIPVVGPLIYKGFELVGGIYNWLNTSDVVKTSIENGKKNWDRVTDKISDLFTSIGDMIYDKILSVIDTISDMAMRVAGMGEQADSIKSSRELVKRNTAELKLQLAEMEKRVKDPNTSEQQRKSYQNAIDNLKKQIGDPQPQYNSITTTTAPGSNSILMAQKFGNNSTSTTSSRNNMYLLNKDVSKDTDLFSRQTGIGYFDTNAPYEINKAYEEKYGISTNVNGLAPEVYKRFIALANEYNRQTGKKIIINSAKRSVEDQTKLNQALPNQTAKPGTSLHEYGLALDLDPNIIVELESMGLLDKHGFAKDAKENWHIQPKEITNNNSPDLFAKQFGLSEDNINEIKVLANKAGNTTSDIANSDTTKTVAAGGLAGLFASGITGSILGTFISGLKGLFGNNGALMGALAAGGLMAYDKIKNNANEAGMTSTDYMKDQAGKIYNDIRDSVTSLGSGESDAAGSGRKETDINNLKGFWDSSYTKEIDDMLTATAKKYGLDPAVFKAYAHIESRGNPNAQANGSQYVGLFQMGKAAATDVGFNYNDMKNPVANAEAAAKYAKQNIRTMTNLGIPEDVAKQPYMLYLAHNQGAGGAAKIWKAAYKGGQLDNETINKMMNQSSEFKDKNPLSFINKIKAATDNRLAKLSKTETQTLANSADQKNNYSRSDVLASLPPGAANNWSEFIEQNTKSSDYSYEVAGLNSTVRNNLIALAAEYKTKTGKKLYVTDGFRTAEDQEDRRRRYPNAAAKGISIHQTGYAVDIKPDMATELDNMGLLRKYGFHRPLKHKSNELQHIEPIGLTRTTAINKSFKMNEFYKEAINDTKNLASNQQPNTQQNISDSTYSNIGLNVGGYHTGNGTSPIRTVLHPKEMVLKGEQFVRFMGDIIDGITEYRKDAIKETERDVTHSNNKLGISGPSKNRPIVVNNTKVQSGGASPGKGYYGQSETDRMHNLTDYGDINNVIMTLFNTSLNIFKESVTMHPHSSTMSLNFV